MALTLKNFIKVVPDDTGSMDLNFFNILGVQSIFYISQYIERNLNTIAKNINKIFIGCKRMLQMFGIYIA